MHCSANLLACTPIAASASASASMIISSSSSCTAINLPNPKTFTGFYNTTSTIPPTGASKYSQNSIACKAKALSSDDSVLMEDLDLYELLGVDSSCDLSQIKLAYRALQKRCHPDIAGPAGHDMAIILNQIYSLLSDPNSRSAYDKEQAKIAELRGYTGKPIYSVWFGAESEERAVFVDEVKCVGCLKCALLAEKTFAVESVYGRARVVAQWADPGNKIQEAIEACPVDCISIVERSNLAALEYLMSKQPRGSVRIGAGNAVGTRVSNIFVDVDKFQARFQEAMNKASAQQSKVPNSQREATSSAVQAIRAISNWLYWQTPSAGSSSENLTRPGSSKRRCNRLPDISKLREAAATRKHARENGKPTLQIPSNYKHNEEYWIPPTLVLPHPTTKDISAGSGPDLESAAAPTEDYASETNNKDFTVGKGKKRNNKDFIIMGVPMAAATVAAAVVGLQVGEGVISSSGRLEEHIGGSLALGIINSSQLQVILAGITWYLISAYVVELVEGLRSKMHTKYRSKMYKK